MYPLQRQKSLNEKLKTKGVNLNFKIEIFRFHQTSYFLKQTNYLTPWYPVTESITGDKNINQNPPFYTCLPITIILPWSDWPPSILFPTVRKSFYPPFHHPQSPPVVAGRNASWLLGRLGWLGWHHFRPTLCLSDFFSPEKYGLHPEHLLGN